MIWKLLLLPFPISLFFLFFVSPAWATPCSWGGGRCEYQTSDGTACYQPQPFTDTFTIRDNYQPGDGYGSGGYTNASPTPNDLCTITITSLGFDNDDNQVGGYSTWWAPTHKPDMAYRNNLLNDAASGCRDWNLSIVNDWVYGSAGPRVFTIATKVEERNAGHILGGGFQLNSSAGCYLYKDGQWTNQVGPLQVVRDNRGGQRILSSFQLAFCGDGECGYSENSTNCFRDCQVSASVITQPPVVTSVAPSPTVTSTPQILSPTPSQVYTAFYRLVETSDDLEAKEALDKALDIPYNFQNPIQTLKLSPSPGIKWIYVRFIQNDGQVKDERRMIRLTAVLPTLKVISPTVVTTTVPTAMPSESPTPPGGGLVVTPTIALSITPIQSSKEVVRRSLPKAGSLNGTPVPPVSVFSDGLGPTVRRTATPSLLEGDANGDGKISLADLSLLFSRIGSSKDHPESDLNKDGTIDLLDIVILTRKIYGI